MATAQNGNVIKIKEFMVAANTPIKQMPLHITPITNRKVNGASFLSAYIFATNRIPIIMHTPLFYSSGIFQSSETLSLCIQSEQCQWLRQTCDEITKGVLARLIRDPNCPDKAKKLSAWKQMFSYDDAAFFRISPHALIMNVETKEMTKIDVENLPKNGMYKVRINPRFAYIGRHGEREWEASISFQIDQLAYKPIEVEKAPTMLAMDLEEFANDQTSAALTHTPQPSTSQEAAPPKKRKRARKSVMDVAISEIFDGTQPFYDDDDSNNNLFS